MITLLRLFKLWRAWQIERIYDLFLHRDCRHCAHMERNSLEWRSDHEVVFCSAVLRKVPADMYCKYGMVESYDCRRARVQFVEFRDARRYTMQERG